MHFDKGPVVIGGGAAGIGRLSHFGGGGSSAPFSSKRRSAWVEGLRTDRLARWHACRPRVSGVAELGTPNCAVGWILRPLSAPHLCRGRLIFVRVANGARLADPRRAWGWLPATLGSGIGSWSDRFKVLRLVFQLAARCSGRRHFRTAISDGPSKRSRFSSSPQGVWDAGRTSSTAVILGRVGLF